MNGGARAETQGVVSVRVRSQLFGVPVLQVQDVINPTRIDLVPLAPPEVAGSLNLRGRIVTAVDMRARLGLPARADDQPFMCVIVEHAGELYALLVDDVGDVLWLSADAFEPTPVTLPAAWGRLCSGLYRLEDELLLSLAVSEVLTLGPSQLAAGPGGCPAYKGALP